MRYFTLLLFTMFFVTNLFADSVEIEVSPRQPLINETFQLIFKVNTQSENEPYISFDAGTASVLGRRFQGVSQHSTMINGRFSTKRIIQYSYDLVTDQARTLVIKNIAVDIDGKSIKHRNLRIPVLAKLRKKPDYFVQAEVTKKKVFVGEPLKVRYYYYHKSKGNIQIEKYPDFKNFTKRDTNIPSIKTDRVQMGNDIYYRSLIWESMLYPEKKGNLTVGTLKLLISYPARTQNNPFGGFGFGLTAMQKKSIKSPLLTIEVLPLPVENVPKGFTGLVGKHNFKLSINKNKFIVNEPIELKLTVSGSGALEQMPAPSLLQDPNLEEFDTKSDLSFDKNFFGRKEFQYTFLTRGSGTIARQDISLSYFNPETIRYETVNLEIPEIKILGASASSTFVTSGKSQVDQSEKFSSIGSKIAGPVFSTSALFTSWYDYLLYLLSLMVGILIVINYLFLYKESGFSSEVEEEVAFLKKNGINYSTLHGVLNKAFPDLDGKFEHYEKKIKQSNMSSDSKEYFLTLLKDTKTEKFGKNRKTKKFIYDRKHFKELMLRDKT